ncbi:SusF/SusE family outer membrane protein [Prevotella merdae]|uniref:SusF/SusE family outer membrane protein n=1 Tax=Prevotella merdae TaxID=2079531 RepID=UPI003F805D95
MVQKITRSLMCCVLFAMSVVSSFAADKLMIIGDAVWGGWNPENSVVMLPAGENVFKATVYLKKVDGETVIQGFKLLTAAKWDCLQYHAGDSNVELGEGVAAKLYDSQENSSDNKFQVKESANYDVVCDLNAKTITATKSAYQDHPVNHNALWMVGTATSGGWDIISSPQMTQDSENPMVFKATTYLKPGEMKIAQNNDAGFDQKFYLRDATDPTKVVLGGDDNKWEITEAATYDVIVNLADMTIDIKKHYADFVVDHLFVIGDAIWSGWGFANSTVLFPDENGICKATLYLEENKGFKFMAESDFEGLQFRAGDADVTLKNDVASSLVSSEDNREDTRFMVSESANYDIVCDVKNKTITLTKSAYQDAHAKHAELWMIGTATPNAWQIDKGVLLKQDAENPMVYTATAELKEGEFKFIVNKYMGFDQTAYVKDAVDDSKVVYGGDDNKWNITEAGTYDVKLDLANMTITVAKKGATGISSVNADVTSPAEYYTLDGKRVNGFSGKGIYIKRQAGKSVKVVVAK